MAKPIDRNTYKLVEWHLRHEKHLRKISADYEADILLGSTGTDWGKPIGSRAASVSDPVTPKVMRLGNPPAKVEQARKWIGVIERAREWFDGSPEAKLLALYYAQPVKIDLAAAKLGTNRRGLERLRDNVVYRCAMMAAAEKLLFFE